MSKIKDTVVLERRFVPEGTLVMKEGDPGNCAYLIQSGSVVVFTEHKGKRVNLSKLELGQIFGEMALIFDDPRTASVEASEDCNLIVLTRQSFKQKLDNTDATIRAIVAMLTQRIVSVNNSLVNKRSNVDDLIETTRLIYQNVLLTMNEEEREAFQADSFPKLEAFLDALGNAPK